jgi:hypothetical protein
VSDVSPFWPPGEPHTLPLPEGVLYDALVRAATARPDHPATLFYGGVLTYAELLRQVDALAGYLQNICGVKRGDRVMVALQNSPQYVIAYYAVMRADAVVVPINPMNKTAELDYIASDSGATVAIVGSDLVDVFAPLLGNVINSIIVAASLRDAKRIVPHGAGLARLGLCDRSQRDAVADDRDASRSLPVPLHIRHDGQAEGLHASALERAVHGSAAGALVPARWRRRADWRAAVLSCGGHAGLDECGDLGRRDADADGALG